MTSARRILLEVCIASVEDALAAQAGGADRLELNTALPLGGLTPSLGLLEEVRRAVVLPLIVMARPRPGGFAYSDADFRVLCRDADLALQRGADAIAFGVLTAEGRIDRTRVARLIEQVGPQRAVFHRAFDVTPDPTEALQTLIDLGVRRVLTSGQQASAYQGAATIAALRTQAAGRIEMLPAGGINPFTLADVLVRTGCDQVHASLRTTREDRSTAARPQVRFGTPVNPPEDRFDATSEELVRQLRAMLG
jgi:copper homeostasis protein